LTVIHVKRERLRWKRADPFVCQVIRADVDWIKAAQIGRGEDDVVARASRIDVHRHALGRAAGISEGVRIVMVLECIERSGAHFGLLAAGAGNTVTDHATGLRGIARVDDSVNRDQRADRRGRRYGNERLATADRREFATGGIAPELGEAAFILPLTHHQLAVVRGRRGIDGVIDVAEWRCVNLLERLLRILQRLGFRSAMVFSTTPGIVGAELAKRSCHSEVPPRVSSSRTATARS